MLTPQEDVDAQVKILLDLKSKYKELTGEDWTPAAGKKADTKQEKNVATKQDKKAEGKQDKKAKDQKCDDEKVEIKSFKVTLPLEGGATREIKKVTR